MARHWRRGPAGHQQLVATLQLAANGATQGEGQRGHVRAENNFVWLAV